MQVWLDDCRAAFSALTSDKQTREAAEAAAESAKSYAQPDDLIDFGHLVSNRKGGLSQLELEDQVRKGAADRLHTSWLLVDPGAASPACSLRIFTQASYKCIMWLSVLG
jgi:hypothetical protein